MPAADWLLAAIILLLTQLLVIALVWWRSRVLGRQLRTLQARRPEPLADVPTSMLVTALSQLDRRLARIEKQLQQAPAAAPLAASSGDRAYDLAQRLARQGASAAQITEASGIGLQEAELLLRLHGPQGG